MPADFITELTAAIEDFEGKIAARDAAVNNHIDARAGISDTADEILDPRLLTLIDSDGKPNLARVGGLLLRHPTQLGALLHMKRATDQALRALGAFLVNAAASGWRTIDKPSASSPGTPESRENFSKVL
jgi:hypothetical protein